MSSLNRIRKAVVIVAVASTLAGIIYFGVIAFHVAKRMSDTEVRSHTLVQVCDAVGTYMDENDGRWPQSWEGLATIQTPPRGIYTWPDEIQLIREEIEIDFTANPAELTDETRDTFSAIQPLGDVYAFAPYGYEALIDTIHNHYPPKPEASDSHTVIDP